jgi:hypothetical protein
MSHTSMSKSRFAVRHYSHKYTFILTQYQVETTQSAQQSPDMNLARRVQFEIAPNGDDETMQQDTQTRTYSTQNVQSYRYLNTNIYLLWHLFVVEMSLHSIVHPILITIEI